MGVDGIMGIAAPRSDWAVENVNLTDGPEKVKIVYIHHSASLRSTGPISVTEEKNAMRSMEYTHIHDRGWAAIGYSKVVFGSGRAYDGRGWGFKQGANYDGGTNESTYSICFDGDFSSKTPTDAAWATAAALISEGVAQGWIDPNYELRGHREEVTPAWHACHPKTVLQCTGKDCPGAGVYNNFDRLVEDAMAFLSDEAQKFYEKMYAGWKAQSAGEGAPRVGTTERRGWFWRLLLSERMASKFAKEAHTHEPGDTQYIPHDHTDPSGGVPRA